MGSCGPGGGSSPRPFQIMSGVRGELRGEETSPGSAAERIRNAFRIRNPETGQLEAGLGVAPHADGGQGTQLQPVNVFMGLWEAGRTEKKKKEWMKMVRAVEKTAFMRHLEPALR